MTALPRDHLGRSVFSNARAAVFVSLRAPVYLFNIVSPEGWSQGRPVVIAGTLTAACIDAVIAWQLRKRNSALLRLRVLLDLIYVCLAAAVVPPTWPYSGVLLILAPTAIELIAVRGLLLGALFVATADIVMYAARSAVVADPYTLELVFYGAWILLIGATAFTAIEFVGKQHQRRFLSEQQAFEHLITLQTRNDMLLGRGGSVTEALNRAWHQLETLLGSAARAARLEFRRQQERLAADTRRQARYLIDVLSDISSAQRATRPAVAEHLHLKVGREHGLHVLAPGQAAALEHQFAEMNLTGLQTVKVVASDQITGELHLVIEDWSLYVPPARGRQLPLAPAAVIFGSGSLLALANPIYANMPLVPVLIVMTCTALLGLAAERRRQKNPRRGLHYLWLAGLAPAFMVLLMTAVVPVQWRLADGRVIIPAIIGLTASLYILGVIWLQLQWGIRLITILLCILWMIAAINLNPFGGPPWASVVGNLAIPASVIFAVHSFESRNRDLGLRLHDQWVANLQQQANDIRRRRVDDETETLQRQIDEATRMVRSIADEGITRETWRHLTEAQLHLQAMRREHDTMSRPAGGH